MTVRVVLDESAIRALSTDTDGPVVRALTRAGEIVLKGQKRRVPTSPKGHIDAGGTKRPSGWLRSSLHAELRSEGRGYVVRVGTGVEYAIMVEYGTRPHEIRPKKPGGVLAFPGAGGSTVFARVVHHPGTTAQPYLRPSLDDLKGAKLT